ETGLSGTGRLHDLFITIEGMTPAEYKNGGRELSITYSFEKSPFGEILIASTQKGICHLVFTDGYQNPLDTLLETFPYARFKEGSDTHQEKARSLFSPKGNTVDTLDLHVKGTGFQLKVWEALLKIPEGKLSSYGHLAKQIGKPKASRAVGTAIGSNPVAYLIPCHRVIQSGGGIGGYRWGENRKWAMIGRECAK
ncbi:MAG: methylated-DNA--[protein]-cysteine S-methyltransferase, partial [Cyclobacteriaceae bacterium]|nr:methylated-DNA--[protein]-cysteine S-methyltransferase [Cyclobacteriaceae bacterium]